MPDFALERDLERELERGPNGAGGRIVIGIDEAGRGPWAGPVVAAAVWLDPGRCPQVLVERLDVSKRLSAARRAELHAALLDCAARGIAALGIGSAPVAEIDALNILEASLRAMARAAADLERNSGRLPGAALVDGNQAPALACPARTVVRGDGLSLSIAAASVVAKVTRDRRMEALARAHPGYGWERNRGYGTAEHRRALARLGVSAQHRRSFRPVRDAMAIR